jgi:hypothetical protein
MPIAGKAANLTLLRVWQRCQEKCLALLLWKIQFLATLPWIEVFGNLANANKGHYGSLDGSVGKMFPVSKCVRATLMNTPAQVQRRTAYWLPVNPLRGGERTAINCRKQEEEQADE